MLQLQVPSRMPHAGIISLPRPFRRQRSILQLPVHDCWQLFIHCGSSQLQRVISRMDKKMLVTHEVLQPAGSACEGQFVWSIWRNDSAGPRRGMLVIIVQSLAGKASPFPAVSLFQLCGQEKHATCLQHEKGWFMLCAGNIGMLFCNINTVPFHTPCLPVMLVLPLWYTQGGCSIFSLASALSHAELPGSALNHVCPQELAEPHVVENHTRCAVSPTNPSWHDHTPYTELHFTQALQSFALQL